MQEYQIINNSEPLSTHPYLFFKPSITNFLSVPFSCKICARSIHSELFTIKAPPLRRNSSLFDEN